MSGKRIVKILSTTAAGAGSAFAFQAPTAYRGFDRDPNGVFQLARTGAASIYSVNLEGRMSPTESWFVVGVLTDIDEDANGSSVLQVATWPEMRANVTSLAGGGTLTGNYQE